jgi:hypothetical protein
MFNKKKVSIITETFFYFALPSLRLFYMYASIGAQLQTKFRSP